MKREQDKINIKVGPPQGMKFKLRKMWQTECGATWPVWELWPTPMEKGREDPLCKCENLKDANLIKELLNLAGKFGEDRLSSMPKMSKMPS